MFKEIKKPHLSLNSVLGAVHSSCLPFGHLKKKSIVIQLKFGMPHILLYVLHITEKGISLFLLSLLVLSSPIHISIIFWDNRTINKVNLSLGLLMLS